MVWAVQEYRGRGNPGFSEYVEENEAPEDPATQYLIWSVHATAFALREEPISEAELSWLWEGQRQPAGSLSARECREITVIYPGRRSGGAGPDFRDAVVRIDGEERIGDVELHVRASSFVGHGHHVDHAYDRLVLHVVYRDDGPGYVRLADGRTIVTAAFAPWVDERQAKVKSWLTRAALWREPCDDAGVRLGDAGLSAVLRAEGEARFAARSRELARARDAVGSEAALWAALLDALAYGGDRAGFARLATALAPDVLAALAGSGGEGGVARVEQALLTVAGLTPPDETGPGLPRAMRPALGSGGSRPANRPERRLAGAARLFMRAGGNLGGYAEASVRAADRSSRLLAAWRVGPAFSGGPALVGGVRATEVLVNAVLPFVAIDPELAGRCLELAAGLKPVPGYGKTAFLEANLGRPGGRRRPRSALEQQGLLALHANWCSQGGCGRCPLS